MTDKQDIQFLIKLMQIQTADEVLLILEKYYPREQTKRATKYFIEELLKHDRPPSSKTKNRIRPEELGDSPDGFRRRFSVLLGELPAAGLSRYPVEVV